MKGLSTTMMLARVQLIILEDGKIQSYSLNEKNKWTVGRFNREYRPNITMHSEIVSRRHAVFFKEGVEWYYQDKGSVNGTWYNGRKLQAALDGKYRPVRLKNGDVLRIDSSNLDRPDDNGVWMLFSTEVTNENWDIVPLQKETMLFGRNPNECDFCIPLPYISGKHMSIALRGGSFYLKDCGSMAGTWLNGHKLDGEKVLHEKDLIALCDCIMVFSDGKLFCNIPQRKHQGKAERSHAENALEDGPIRNGSRKKGDQEAGSAPIIIKADIRSKIVPDSSGHGTKELIRNVQVEVQEGSLVALLGGSGAGKTTVMNCMNGMDTRGVKGTVEFMGVDLLHNFERMKHLIGSVPQREVFHESLTVEEELREAAILRLPRDTKKSEIKANVDRTIGQLSLEGIRKNRIGTCSGGEKKRVNIAIELVADRKLLCLDEPDAALDPGMKRELFQILRNLSHNEGKSILVIIHDVSEIDLFDQIIMMAKMDDIGRLAFAGTPEEARAYFGKDIKDAYELLKKEPQNFVQ